MGNVAIRGLFSEEEKEKIRQAVVAAEAFTSGEIATMVVARSDPYRDGQIICSLLMAGLVALVVAIAGGHVTVWSYIPLVLILFWPGLLACRKFPRLSLPFLGRRRVEQAVRERAIRAFYEHGLHRTAAETGILIFISLLERKVWILADRGIDRQIDPGVWHSLARETARGIAEQQACTVLCSVIAQCGAELGRCFPRTQTDRNELPDEPII